MFLLIYLSFKINKPFSDNSMLSEFLTELSETGNVKFAATSLNQLGMLSSVLEFSRRVFGATVPLWYILLSLLEQRLFLCESFCDSVTTEFRNELSVAYHLLPWLGSVTIVIGHIKPVFRYLFLLHNIDNKNSQTICLQ